MGLFPAYRGIKIKPYMMNLRYFIFSFLYLVLYLDSMCIRILKKSRVWIYHQLLSL